MNKKTIIVVGYGHQTQTSHQIQYLLDSGVEVVNIDPYGVDGCYGGLSWENGRVSWKDHDISPDKIHGVLVCAQTSEYPYQQQFDQHPKQSLDWDDWYQCFGLQRDRSDTLLGLMLSYEQAGLRMFNPPSKSLISRRKPFQISVMQSVPCKMPATLISNEPDKAEAFIRATGDCIIKPAAGGSLTLSANDLLENGGLEQLKEAPAIIQKRVYGDDLRVIVVDGEVCSSVAVNVPENSIDFRGETVYQTGQATYREVILPKVVQQQCVLTVEKLGLKYGGIDIKHTSDDQYYLLECNSSPIYLDVERKLQHPITAALCDALMK